jgi:hypothetical protein
MIPTYQVCQGSAYLSPTFDHDDPELVLERTATRGSFTPSSGINPWSNYTCRACYLETFATTIVV